MRVAFVIGSLSGGGAERVVSILASQIQNEGNDVAVLTIASNKISYEINPNVQVIDCSRHFSIRVVSFLKRIHLINKNLSLFKPDIIVSFTVGINVYSVLSCLFRHYKLILCERNDPRYDPVDKKLRFLRKVLYNFADGFVFQTTGERDFFSNRIQKKSVVIPNPVSDKIPKPYLGEYSKKVVSVARLQKQKNYPVAIRAFAEFNRTHQDYIYEIYGEGELLNDLKKCVDSYGLNNKVIFKGHSSNVYERIKDASVFILSSDYEGISNSMLEAMAMGIPTISTDYPSGGARDVIKDGINGFLVPVNDSSQMAKKMSLLVDDIELQNSIRQQSVKVRETFESNKITKIWMDYIKGLFDSIKK